MTPNTGAERSKRTGSNSPRLKNFKFNPERKNRAWFQKIERRDLVDALTIVSTSALSSFLISFGGPYPNSLGVFFSLFLVGLAVGLFLLYEFPKDRPRDVKNLQVLRLAGLTIASVVIGRFFLSFGWSPYLIPLPMLTATATIAFGRQLAVLHSWSICGALAIAVARWPLDPQPGPLPEPLLDVPFFFSMGVASTVMAFCCDKIQNRGTLLRAGLLAGLVVATAAMTGQILFKMPSLEKSYERHQAARTLRDQLDEKLAQNQGKDAAQSAQLIQERSQAVKAMWREYVDFFGHSFWGFINCAFSGFFLYEILRWIERFFGVVTRLHLVQLADLNEPLLRRLNMETPGTYHHCQMVAQLGEAAAEDIGADSLLVRVGAYYHDIGKMAKPHYFTENNPFSSKKHGRLTPTLSTLIIHAHVKDGIELAHSLNLPQKIIDFIPEHHGTTACEFFYRQAVDHAKANNLPIPDKDMFRYPGPKPRTKETAIILVSDSVEAATRSLKNPSPGRIRGLVHEIIIDKLLDHQFDECPLTLGELGTIEDTLVRKLTWMHHARIRYPEKVQTKQQAKLKALDRERHGGLDKDPSEVQGPKPEIKAIESKESKESKEGEVAQEASEMPESGTEHPEKSPENEKKTASNTQDSDPSARPGEGL